MVSCLRRYGIVEHLVPEEWATGIAKELLSQNAGYGLLLTHSEFNDQGWYPFGWPLAVWLNPRESQVDLFWDQLEEAIQAVKPASVILIGPSSLAPRSWRDVIYSQRGVCNP